MSEMIDAEAAAWREADLPLGGSKETLVAWLSVRTPRDAAWCEAEIAAGRPIRGEYLRLERPLDPPQPGLIAGCYVEADRGVGPVSVTWSQLATPGAMPSEMEQVALALAREGAGDETITHAGWVQRPSGDIWSDADDRRARPIAYRVGGGWMVSGNRSLDELRAIVAYIERGAEI